MKIILQNLIEKLNKLINDNLNSKLDEIMKDFNGYSINNYLSLISNSDLNMNSFICNTIIEINKHTIIKKKPNIKELFINNIKSKEIINLNNEILDYSIFDTENEYKVTKKYLKRQLAI